MNPPSKGHGQFLDNILIHKRREITEAKATQSLAALKAEASRQTPPRDLAVALNAPGVSLIAEVKRASPSKGWLAADLDPARQAQHYAAGGAAAISVLTDREFFKGTIQDLRAVRAAVELPVLRKDFILDAYQVYEARAAGADAILLIAAALSSSSLQSLRALALDLGMQALVEVHSKEELLQALALPRNGSPLIVGINNRDLRTFKVDLNTTERLRPLVPPDVIVVAESGVTTPEDVSRLAALQVHAMLVGSALVTTADPKSAVRQLVEAGRRSVPHLAAEPTQRAQVIS
ncbi:MAG TPA: indole-3-glycerol phosphate synthase TrpC [Chloroflexi bacterium]|nr:indole-3-glycerol phosphate synthase TrpC [Chloroflexota bacterium]